MDGFTILDGVVAAIIVLSALLAYSRGLVRELMAIAGWVIAGVLAFLFAPNVEPLVKEIPYVGDFLRGSCELSIIAAFTAVFAVALLVTSIFTPLFSTIVQRSAIGGLDQAAGFVFGAARGILLVLIALVVFDRVTMGSSVAMVDDSRTAAVFASVRANIDNQIPEDAPGWILSRYEQLVGACGEPVGEPT
jgi:membrane protein required for colicin V production